MTSIWMGKKKKKTSDNKKCQDRKAHEEYKSDWIRDKKIFDYTKNVSEKRYTYKWGTKQINNRCVYRPCLLFVSQRSRSVLVITLSVVSTILVICSIWITVIDSESPYSWSILFSFRLQSCISMFCDHDIFQLSWNLSLVCACLDLFLHVVLRDKVWKSLFDEDLSVMSMSFSIIFIMISFLNSNKFSMDLPRDCRILSFSSVISVLHVGSIWSSFRFSHRCLTFDP